MVTELPVTDVLVAVHVDTGEHDDAESLRTRVAALDGAGVHALTFAPGPDGGLTAVEAASFAAAWTERVGLVAVVNPVHAEPFHLSNQLSSLDRISRGRAGWWLDVVDDAAHARAHGTEPVGSEDATALAHDVAEVVEAARLLWDSWEDGALIADRATCRFLDAERVRHVDFVGRRFSVKGPALLPRPPQGHVPVLAEARWLPADARDVTVVRAPCGTDTVGGPVLVDVAVTGEPGHVAAAVGRVVDQIARWAAAAVAGTTGASPVGRQDRGHPRPLVVRLVPDRTEEAWAVVGQVLVALPARGLAAPPPGPGRTLRDHLGLERPEGRAGDPTARPAPEHETTTIGARP
ncbi:LLM class flavin-dependent oxidoreductase [Cellulosimicrobium sp. NPDC057862]|uniref:LLM class flavin-dependent oxidoreductase n=1 Tax=Cellulosimicrobium sp. NPDC057862 TaxID=3346266 RepID=UPI0036701DEB